MIPVTEAEEAVDFLSIEELEDRVTPDWTCACSCSCSCTSCCCAYTW